MNTKEALTATHRAGRKTRDCLTSTRGMVRAELMRTYDRDLAGVARRTLETRIAVWTTASARGELTARDRAYREALGRGDVAAVRDAVVDADRGVEVAIARGWIASTIHATEGARRAADDGSRPALQREYTLSEWRPRQHWRQHETQWKNGRARTRTYAAMEITPRAYVVISPDRRSLGWVIGDRRGVARARDGALWLVSDDAVMLTRGRTARKVSHHDLERGLLDGPWSWMPADLAAAHGAVEYGSPAVRAAEIARKRRLARLGLVVASATPRAARLLARLSTKITATLDDARAAGFCAAGIRSYLRAQGRPSATQMTTRDLVLSGDPRAITLAVTVASRSLAAEVRS